MRIHKIVFFAILLGCCFGTIHYSQNVIPNEEVFLSGDFSSGDVDPLPKKERIFIASHFNSESAAYSKIDFTPRNFLGSANTGRHFLALTRASSELLYYFLSETIDLRLNRFSIAFIFHSFP